MSIVYQAVASDTGQVYTYSGAYPGTGTATNVIVVAGMGPGAPTAPSTGWKTLLDVDFEALTNQALHTDGVVTLSDGSSWTKSGSAKDGTTHPWAIVNGTGLVTSAVSGGHSDNGFEVGDLTFPTLWPNLALGTLTGISRVPVKVSAIWGTVDDPTESNGVVGIALEARDITNGVGNRMISCIRRGVSAGVFYNASVRAYYRSTNPAATDDSVESSPIDNVTMLECPSGLFLGQALGYTAHVAANAFPTNPGAAYRCRGVTPYTSTQLNNYATDDGVWTPDNWKCSIINGLNNTGSIAVVTRFKVEAFF